MLGVQRPEHVVLAEEFVVVLLGLRIESRIVIGVPRVRRGPARSGRGAQDRFIDAAKRARACTKTPGIVTTLRIGIAPADETRPANFLGSKEWIQREQPVASGRAEVGVSRNRLHLGAAN